MDFFFILVSVFFSLHHLVSLLNPCAKSHRFLFRLSLSLSVSLSRSLDETIYFRECPLKSLPVFLPTRFPAKSRRASVELFSGCLERTTLKDVQ